MIIDWSSILLLSFGLGLMHALDADHIMTISMLANKKQSIRRTVMFSANWAIGHGTTLAIAGLLLFGLNLSIPENLQYGAEVAVGLLLISLGLYSFWQFRVEKIKLVQHQHGEITHTHWQLPNHANNPTKSESISSIKAQHKPVMIGMLHGLAGSAPALALVPLVSSGQLSLGLKYLLIFSMGSLLAMVLFSMTFSYFQKLLQTRFQSVFYWNQRIFALGSIALGGYWLTLAI